MAVEFIRPQTSWIEFGYPSDYTHFLKDEPFLGFRGALGLCSRLANEVTKGFCLDWLTPQQLRSGPGTAAGTRESKSQMRSTPASRRRRS